MDLEILIPLAAALLAGSLIGLEREVLGRPAGLRTHALVCLTCAALMVAAVRQEEWRLALAPQGSIVADPTRMAHGVLTGIGFLCAGVIFRQGFSVQGLTTAASLWATASIGVLFGVGMYGLALAASVGTGLVLIVFRILYARLPRFLAADLVIRSPRAGGLDEARVRGLASDLGLQLNHVSLRLIDEGRLLEFRARVACKGGVPGGEVAARLVQMPEVIEFEILPHDE